MAIGTATAILGSAVIGAGASALNSKSAAKSAANSSQYATDQSIAFNNKVLETQQANTEPYRNAGAAGVQALLQQLGISPVASASGGQAGGMSAAEIAKWDQYLAENPDVAQSVRGASGNQYAGSTPEERAADHYMRYGKSEGRTLPTTPAAQPTAPTPTNPSTPDPNRPALTETPGYQSPEFIRTDAYRAPSMDPLDISLGKYQKSPGYDFQQQEASRATLAGSAATGALRSGAAAKALQDRAQNIANLDYTNWRDYTTGQYNTDRNYNAQQAQFAYNALLGQNQAQTAFNQANSQFGYNALTNQNNLKNQYTQQNYSTDRAFNADQNQQKTNNLFSLAGLGASAAGSANNALGANAANNSNALFSNASAQGNAALASAGQINNAINTGTNALAWYLGNKGGGGTYGPVA